MSSNSMLGRGSPGTASLEDGYVNPNSRQVGGNHYSRSEYQHWDYATDLRMCHLEGAGSKYLARAGNKDGEDRDKDLEKALHYLEKLLDVFKQKRISSLIDRQGAGVAVEPLVARFIASSMSGAAFTPRAVAALVGLSRWSGEDELVAVITLVKSEWLEEKAKPKVAVAEHAR